MDVEKCQRYRALWGPLATHLRVLNAENSPGNVLRREVATETRLTALDQTHQAHPSATSLRISCA